MKRKKIKEWCYDIFLYLGVIGFILGVSWGFIEMIFYIENRMTIWIYVILMFIVSPIAAYVCISLYMWLLDKVLTNWPNLKR